MKQRLHVLLILICALGAVTAGAERETSQRDKAERVVVRAYYDDADLLRSYFTDAVPWQVEPDKRFVVVDVDQKEYDGDFYY